ncbi:YbaB/EbfC family nucleoid-associated protein [Streptococcus agalactiae]
MMNMQNMMRQAQKLQKQMEQKQADLAASQFTGKSAQELVTVTFTGDKKLISIDYKEAVVDPEDIETLQDMTTQAINDALSQVDDATKKIMGAFAGKMPLDFLRN